MRAKMLDKTEELRRRVSPLLYFSRKIVEFSILRLPGSYHQKGHDRQSQSIIPCFTLVVRTYSLAASTLLYSTGILE